MMRSTRLSRTSPAWGGGSPRCTRTLARSFAGIEIPGERDCFMIPSPTRLISDRASGMVSCLLPRGSSTGHENAAREKPARRTFEIYVFRCRPAAQGLRAKHMSPAITKETTKASIWKGSWAKSMCSSERASDPGSRCDIGPRVCRSTRRTECPEDRQK